MDAPRLDDVLGKLRPTNNYSMNSTLDDLYGITAPRLLDALVKYVTQYPVSVRLESL